MATLPIIPVPTALTIGGLAVTGLVGFVAHTRTKLESQVHDNARAVNQLLAEIAGGNTRPTALPTRSAQTS
jgi:hypothetical protein